LKKSPLIILVISGIFITLGIIAYYEVIQPIYQSNNSQIQEIDVSKKNKMSFGKHAGQENIFSIEIELSGSLDSNFDLVISDENQDKHAAVIKGKKIDFVYKTDWYSDSCFLSIYPKGKNKGKVKAEVRFLSL
jgi:hypothetical protein